MIVYFYLFDLFKNLFIIPIGFNGSQHSSNMGPARAKVMVDPISMQLVVVPFNILHRAFKFIEMFNLKFFEINLNTIS